MVVPIDLSVPADLSGADLTQVPDLTSNADMYKPLFAPQVNYGAENGPIYLATADLNKDGKRDLIVVNTNDPFNGGGGGAVASSVNVLLGNGDGTFQAKTSTPIDPFPFGIAVADVNGDTNTDIVIVLYDGYQVVLGDGAGGVSSITKFVVGDNLRGVALGDIDGDGKLDVVVADLGSVTGKVWVAVGNGAGSFGTATSFEVSLMAGADARSPKQVRLGDMNNDGKLDIVTVNITNFADVSSISVLANTRVTNGTVSISATPIEITNTGRRPLDLLLAQLDGANKLDIVVANGGDIAGVGAGVSVLLSDTAGSPITFGTAANYTTGLGPAAIVFGDIDGDSRVDLITADSLGGTATVLYGGGGGVFGLATMNRPGVESYAVGNNPISIVAATFNADVKIDVATANQNAQNVSVLINQR